MMLNHFGILSLLRYFSILSFKKYEMVFILLNISENNLPSFLLKLQSYHFIGQQQMARIYITHHVVFL